MGEHTDRVILVSGASGGLGDTVVRVFLEAGAVVAGIARNWRKAPDHPRFFPVNADVTTAAGAHSAVAAAMAKFARVDALVHLLGGFAGGKPVPEIDDETWQSMIAVNLTPAFFLCRAVLPHMAAAKRGRIVAVSSRTSLEPDPNLGAYTVSKAGLNALIRTVAAEGKLAGITANAVLPTIIDTAANRGFMPQADYSSWVKPASLASLILWLTSDAAADVNGALIPCYGRV